MLVFALASVFFIFVHPASGEVRSGYLSLNSTNSIYGSSTSILSSLTPMSTFVLMPLPEVLQIRGDFSTKAFRMYLQSFPASRLGALRASIEVDVVDVQAVMFSANFVFIRDAGAIGNFNASGCYLVDRSTLYSYTQGNVELIHNPAAYQKRIPPVYVGDYALVFPSPSILVDAYGTVYLIDSNSTAMVVNYLQSLPRQNDLRVDVAARFMGDGVVTLRSISDAAAVTSTTVASTTLVPTTMAATTTRATSTQITTSSLASRINSSTAAPLPNQSPSSTGSEVPFWVYILVALVALGLFVLLVIAGKRQKDKKSKEKQIRKYKDKEDKRFQEQMKKIKSGLGTNDTFSDLA